MDEATPSNTVGPPRDIWNADATAFVLPQRILMTPGLTHMHQPDDIGPNFRRLWNNRILNQNAASELPPLEVVVGYQPGPALVGS